MKSKTDDARYSFAMLKRDLGEDILGHTRHGADFYGHRVSRMRKLSILLTPAMMCVSLFRLSHWAWSHGHERLAWNISHFNQLLHGAMLHPAGRIGGGFYVPHTVGIIFEGHAGHNLVLFANAMVASGRCHPYAWMGGEGAPVLGNDVTVGAYAIVSGAIALADRVRVAPRASVDRDVPANSLVIGSSRSLIHIPGSDAARGELSPTS